MSAPTPSERRQASRREAVRERWRQSVSTSTKAESEYVRTRNRHLPGTSASATDDALVLQHNAWDYIEWSEEEVAAAERVVGAQASVEADRTASTQAAHWGAHYHTNLRNYNDRHYLHNVFPELLTDSPLGGSSLVVLETGCGAGNALFPLLAFNPRVRILACDIAASAVSLVNERLDREGLNHRALAPAFVWDLSERPPAEVPKEPFAHLVLAVFTLSALRPEALPTAFEQLHRCLLPGGKLLLRDYGRLDMKQLKFSRTEGSRLQCSSEYEWYQRGDGTTVVFFSLEHIRRLAEAAGFVVESVKMDKRMLVNRADKKRMQRVWLVATLRKPEGAGGVGGLRAKMAHSAASAVALLRRLGRGGFGGGRGRSMAAILLGAGAIVFSLARLGRVGSPGSVAAGSLFARQIRRDKS